MHFYIWWLIIYLSAQHVALNIRVCQSINIWSKGWNILRKCHALLMLFLIMTLFYNHALICQYCFVLLILFFPIPSFNSKQFFWFIFLYRIILMNIKIWLVKIIKRALRLLNIYLYWVIMLIFDIIELNWFWFHILYI